VAHSHLGVVSGSRAVGDPTSFVGRRDELSGVRSLLSASRLVTLTGAGGVGKTRLARQAAAEVRRAFPDGVWFVDLATGADRAGESDVPAAARLAARAGDRRTLLVLDGCE
jgi:predicted ATPase